ncbi:MAG TPA: hypothetical protein DCW29_00950, partial [Janthinobacterium sp.]|nr:hypothetical protein [Janthinobacterium sp.]
SEPKREAKPEPKPEAKREPKPEPQSEAKREPRPEAKPERRLAQRAAPPAPAAAEEVVPGLRDLPEPIQRQIPALALGGYIYSKNPADRLVLIDKVLRHEGEEVAPGLVLEKLQAKAAIFNFKGYHYRIAY